MMCGGICSRFGGKWQMHEKFQLKNLKGGDQSVSWQTAFK